MSHFRHVGDKPSLQFFALAVFVTFAIVTGGSSRNDVQSLLLLYPTSIFACVIAALTLKRAQFRQRIWLFAGFATLQLLCFLQYLPLRLGGLLPSELLEIDRITVSGAVTRSLTIAPTPSWDSFLHLFASLAVLVFGVQLTRNDLYRLLPLVVALGGLSGLFGVLQAIGNAEGPLYFYEITNRGNAVGLFANRNHAALLLACMFPMLAVFAISEPKRPSRIYSRKLIAASLALILVPLLLVTGSRSGIVLGFVGIAGGAILYRSASTTRQTTRRSVNTPGWIMVAAAVTGLSLVFLTIFFSRAEALDRLFSGSQMEDMRSQYWLNSIELFWTYFPIGAGSGSFADVYRVIEPDHLLGANYVNRAHNDWLETAIAFGLPGTLLMAASVMLYLRQCFLVWWIMDGRRRSVLHARMVTIIFAMIAMASLTDYPLRTPFLSCLFMLMLLWLVQPMQSRDGGVPT